MSNKTSRVAFDRIEVGVLGNCRKKLTDIPALAADIKERGLLQNLVVWHKRLGGGQKPHELDDGTKVHDRYILISGHRRHAAIEMIREDDADAFDSVPVTLFTGTETDAMMAQLAENLSRKDLTPTETADAIYRLRSKDIPIATIAQRLAVSGEWVRQLLKLREACTEEVQEAVSEGRINMSTALDLAMLTQEEQLVELAKYKDGSSAGERRAVRKATRRAAGRSVRPGAKEIRERFAKLEESKSQHAAAMRKVLAWVLGQGDWL